MKEEMPAGIERRVKRVNNTMYVLTNQIVELKEEYGVDMWQHVITYMEEKREVA